MTEKRPAGWYLARVSETGEEFFRLNDVLKALIEQAAPVPVVAVAETPAPVEAPPVPLPPTGQSVDRPPEKCVRKTCNGPISLKDPNRPDVFVCHACGYHIVWLPLIQKWQPVKI